MKEAPEVAQKGGPYVVDGRESQAVPPIRHFATTKAAALMAVERSMVCARRLFTEKANPPQA